MSHSIHPSPQAATFIKDTKAQPKLNMDLLQQITLPIRIRFIAPYQPVEGRPVRSDCLLV